MCGVKKLYGKMRGKGDYGGNRNFNSKGYQGRRSFGGRANNQGQNRHFKSNPKPFIPHVSFDLIQAENSFQRVKPVSPADDKAFNDALVKRSQDLTPTANEQTHLLNLVTKVQSILDNLVIAPGDFDSCQFDEIKQVGAFKNGTLSMATKLIADICVVLKTLPTREAVLSLGNKVFDELKKEATAVELPTLHMNTNDSGFEIVSVASAASIVDVAVQMLVTTQYQNIRKLDANLHLDAKICQQSLSTVKHARWFEENASNSTVKVIVRLLRDLQARFEGLQPLTPWIIDLLSWYATMNNPKREALPVSVAFKRVFQLIAAGFFLPGSAGIIDPCEHSPTRVHTTMTLDQQDMVCYTFQTLLRVFAHGGFRQILGLEGNSSIASTPSVWAGVVVIPSSKAYEPSKELEQIEEPKEEEPPEAPDQQPMAATAETDVKMES